MEWVNSCTNIKLICAKIFRLQERVHGKKNATLRILKGNWVRTNTYKNVLNLATEVIVLMGSSANTHM